MTRAIWIIAAALSLATASRAEGIDRDTLLTDSPATPDQGTVRVSGGGTGRGATTDAGGTSSGNTGNVVGSIGWTPIEHLHLDVGAFFQTGVQGGPAARVRYQILSQSRHGLDLTGGMRFKTVSFHSSGCTSCINSGEVEFITAAGKSFGKFDFVLNGVFGVETGGGGGKDLEAKAFQGYRFTDTVRGGLDERLQTEVGDSETPGVTRFGRDYDLTAGPAVSWLVMKNVQLQALLGVAQPKRTNDTTPVGILSASVDF